VISTFALVEHDHDTPGWAEAMVGPSYVSKCFEAGMLFGFETGKDFWRFSPWMILRSKNEQFSMLAVYENGASGEGFRFEGYARVTKSERKLKFYPGFVVHSSHCGPSFKFGKEKMYFFLAPYLVSWKVEEQPLTLLGIGADL
jgi:hypothetical protein